MHDKRQESRLYGEKIRHERRRLGLNQTDFARLGGVSKATQVAYEAGTTLPQIDYLARLHLAGVDALWILTEMPEGYLGPWQRELLSEIWALVEEWASERGKPTPLAERQHLVFTLYHQFLQRRKIDAAQAGNVLKLKK